MAVDIELERMVIRLLGDGSAYRTMLKQAVKDTDTFTRTVTGQLRNAKGHFQKEFGKMDLGKTLTGAKLKEGAKLTQQMASATENYANRMAKLNNLLKTTAISQVTYDRAAKAAMQTMKMAEKQTTLKKAGAFTSAGANLKTVGGTGSLMVSTPLIAGGAMAVKAALEYESAFTVIRALSNATEAEVVQYGETLKRVALETGRSPLELANALKPLASSGLKAADVMQTLEMSAKASAIGLGETKVVADLVSSAISAYGSENITAERTVDMLVAAVREGKGEASAFAQSMGFVIPIAAAMGVELDEVMGSVSAMTQKGMQVDHAVTALKGILTDIIHPSEQATDALSAMGIEGMSTFTQLQQVVKDEGLFTALNKLWTATNGNAEAIGQLFPEVRGLTGVFNLMGTDAQRTANIIDAVGDSFGDMTTAFAVGEGTAGRKIDKMFAQLQLSLIGIGEHLLPLAVQFAQFVQSMLEGWEALSPETQSAIIMFAELAAVTFPVIYAMGVLSSSVGAMIGLWPTFTALTGLASKGLSTFGLSLGPVAVAAMLAAGAVLYLRNMVAAANAEAGKSRGKVDLMAEDQLEQIRGLAGPEQKEAMDLELNRRQNQLTSLLKQKESAEAELRQEGTIKSSIRGLAGVLTGADVMGELNKDIESAERQVRAGKAFEKEMIDTAKMAEAMGVDPEELRPGAGPLMSKQERKMHEKDMAAAESLRKKNLSPEQRIAEEHQQAIASHAAGLIGDEELASIEAGLNVRAERLQGRSPESKQAVKENKERQTLAKRVADRRKSPAQKRAEEAKRLHDLTVGATGVDVKTGAQVGDRDDGMKKNNALLTIIADQAKKEEGKPKFELKPAEGF